VISTSPSTGAAHALCSIFRRNEAAVDEHDIALIRSQRRENPVAAAQGRQRRARASRHSAGSGRASRTRRYSSDSRVSASHRAGPGASTGAARRCVSTRAISARFQARRCTCQTPSAAKPTQASNRGGHEHHQRAARARRRGHGIVRISAAPGAGIMFVSRWNITPHRGPASTITTSAAVNISASSDQPSSFFRVQV